MDKSLDEVISSRPKGPRRGASRRGGAAAKAQLLGVHPATRTATATKGATITPAAQPTDKIIVSNLPGDVNEVQIRVCLLLTTKVIYLIREQELFSSTVGPLREVTLHYDSAGRSKGVAAVHFQKKGDGTRAYQQYNNRLIDGTLHPLRGTVVAGPVWPCQDDMNAWQTRLNASSQVSLVVESCTRGLDSLEAGAGLQVVRRLSPFELVILVPSHLQATPHGLVSGLGSRSVQALWSYKRGRGTPKSSSLDQFQGSHSRASLGYCGIFGRTESTVILPTNECLSLLHSVYSHVNRTERPMKIEIVVDPARPAPPASLASRVAPPASTAPATEPRGTRTAARGSRRGRGRGRKPNERPQKSVADLDAEMEDYTATSVVAPAAA
ncbi:hypothetical protein AZE42_06611 [Rhizopogon vesiculosus]|uniref:RRM domain-containing protein n=1 Tax=Rhizopogon vesiculosus TaxID=180088 RepID=A0A1J8QQ22_9AGAM|nr:hypothetical protein AZE42_06611 [Rhizopogon vesiculosus]